MGFSFNCAFDQLGIFIPKVIFARLHDHLSKLNGTEVAYV